jgi:hypothetical protein
MFEMRKWCKMGCWLGDLEILKDGSLMPKTLKDGRVLLKTLEPTRYGKI